MLTKSKKDIEIELNYLAYSRYVSRAHTIFNTYFEILGGTIIGLTGLIITLLKLEIILEFNKYYIIKIFLYITMILSMITLFALITWYDSRMKRIKIINQIKKIQQNSFIIST